jgi:pyrimidine-specific ribonucleoside hydrolase
MKRIVQFLVLLFLISSTPLWAHEESTPVIVDTDMALDDVRALLLTLGSQQLKVKAVVTSDGASSPEAGCRNLRRIFRYLGREDIPIGAGKDLHFPPPPWRAMSESLGWADLGGKTGIEGATPPSVGESGGCPDSVPLLRKVLAETEQGVSYICIGPLTNLAELLKADPDAAKKIKRVFYYGSTPDDPKPDWNTGRDAGSAGIVFSSGIPVFVVRPQDEQLLTFDNKLLEEIRKTDSPESRFLALMYASGKTSKLLEEGHFKAWDESVPLYLDHPEIASFARVEGERPVYRLTQWEENEARADYLRLFGNFAKGGIGERIPVVFEAYPVEPARFRKDLRPWVEKIIAVNGLEEWKSAVLTNELHRHLGIYSLIGAKMGIAAREILHATLDELNVESRAGLRPPFSCLNDGLQVSTGASLGRGTITVPENDRPAVEALFIKGGRVLRLRLKENIRERIASDIRNAVMRYGDTTPEYFREVRRLSFDYWLKLNRKEIFEREFVSP